MRRINHGRRLSRGATRRLVVPFALVALTGLVLAGAAGTATATKAYTATFSPVPSATVPGGASANVHVQIVNNAGQQAIQSANITAPSGFTITGVSPALNPYSSFDSAQIRLRQVSIAPGGGPYHLDITVTTPCAAGDYLWAIRAKQSNDFNGPPGNDFTLTTSESNLKTRVASAALSHFTVTAGAGGNIGDQKAGEPFTVKATAYDTCGNVKTDYQGGATLTGNLGSTPSNSPQYGALGAGGWTLGTKTTSVTAVKAPETLRTLTATAADQLGTSSNSNPFDVSAGPPHFATFVQQPTDAQVNTTIVPAVTVEAKDQYGNLSGGYQLALAITPGTGASGAALTGGGPGAATTTDAQGVATFSSLSIDKVSGSLGTAKYTLDAKYGGTKLQTNASATSSPFSIDLVLTDCDPDLTSCTLPQQNLPSPKGTTTTITATATDLVDGGFTGISFNLGSPTPANVLAAGGGCAYFQTSGAAGVLLEIRPFAQGVLVIDYGIPTKLIQASPNNGNKFVPICAHARRVDALGVPLNCAFDLGGPFVGRELDANGVLTGNLRNAVCDPETGEWWGILGTYQDAIPTSDPRITGWTSGTAPDGTSLRIFTIRVPAPWDWGHSG